MGTSPTKTTTVRLRSPGLMKVAYQATGNRGKSRHARLIDTDAAAAHRAGRRGAEMRGLGGVGTPFVLRPPGVSVMKARRRPGAEMTEELWWNQTLLNQLNGHSFMSQEWKGVL